MNENAESKSKRFGRIQTILLALYAVGYFAIGGSWLFPPGGIAGIVGLVASLGGVALLLAAIVALRGVVQVAPEPRAGGHLVTSGVYSRFRHPIYSGIVLVVIGLFLRKPTVTVAVLSATVIGFLIVKVRFEEERLTARYPEYSDYRARAWGVIPWLT